MRPRISARHIPVAILLVIYAVILGALVARHPVATGHGDPIDYMEGAKNLRAYDSAYHPPFYSAAIAAVALVTRDVFVAAKVVSMLAALAVVLLTWALGWVCFGSGRVAMLAALLVASSSTIVQAGYSVGSDVTGAALFLAAVCALARAGHGRRPAWLALAGAVAGLAYLTRYIYAGLVVAGLGYVLLALPGRFARKLTWAAVFAGTFLVVIAPWTLTNIVRHGNLNNLNHANIAFAIFDTGDSWIGFERFVEKYPTLLTLVVSEPGPVLRHMAKNAFHFPAEMVFRYCLLAGVLSVFGLLSALRRPTIERMALITSGGVLLLLTLLVWFEPRFFVPLIPVVMLFGAHVIVQRVGGTPADYWPQDGAGADFVRRIPLRGLVAALTLAVAFAVAAKRVPADFAKANIDDELRAGHYLHDHTPPGTPILTSSRNLAWYADRPYISLSKLKNTTEFDLVEQVTRTRAGVIVYTKRHSTYTHPQLEFLLDPDDERIPDTFRLLYRAEGKWPVTAYRVGE